MDLSIPTKERLSKVAAELVSEHFHPGIDDMTSNECLNYLLINGDAVSEQLVSGCYKPKPALSFSVIQKSGKERMLCRLSAIDTVIQRFVARELADYCENFFSDYSHAYRHGRGRHTAVAQYMQFAKDYKYAVKVDIKNCFDSIEHDTLLKKARLIIDNEIYINIVKALVETPVANESGISNTAVGLIQGAPISPILCNMYLHTLDAYLSETNINFCRYADDIVAFSQSEDEAICFLNNITEYLSENLKLSINTEKLSIKLCEEMLFLGYSFQKSEDGLVFATDVIEKNITFNNRWVHDYGKGTGRKADILSDGILTKKDFTLLFEGETANVIPIKSVDYINIYSSVTLAPQTIKTTSENGVTINYFDKYGHLLGRFEPTKKFNDISLALLQLQTYNNDKLRTEYAKNILISSIHNIRLNIRYYKKQTNSTVCEDAVAYLDKIESDVKNTKFINDLLLIEARMRELYYSCFNEFIKDSRYYFYRRTRRPPLDEINSLISFGNTFLYNLIAMEINKTPLDIRIGFLHATNKRYESLNLDLADIFKPLIIDRTIFTLINKHIISFESHFQREENGAVYLTKDGKRLFLEALYNKLNQQFAIGDEKLTYHQIITQDIRNLCASLRGKKVYKGYRQVR